METVPSNIVNYDTSEERKMPVLQVLTCWS